MDAAASVGASRSSHDVSRSRTGSAWSGTPSPSRSSRARARSAGGDPAVDRLRRRGCRRPCRGRRRRPERHDQRGPPGIGGIARASPANGRASRCGSLVEPSAATWVRACGTTCSANRRRSWPPRPPDRGRVRRARTRRLVAQHRGHGGLDERVAHRVGHLVWPRVAPRYASSECGAFTRWSLASWKCTASSTTRTPAASQAGRGPARRPRAPSGKWHPPPRRVRSPRRPTARRGRRPTAGTPTDRSTRGGCLSRPAGQCPALRRGRGSSGPLSSTLSGTTSDGACARGELLAGRDQERGQAPPSAV